LGEFLAVGLNTFAEWMKADLKKRGFKGPETMGAHGEP
jgi:hypothetical protein